jgi:cytoskeleton protein RodZ
MFEIGPSLREARMRRGLSSEDVQKAIRIRDRYLHALEEERWELLPGDAYVKGFLRTYAEFLGLDGNLYGAASPVETGRIGLMRPLLAIAAIVAVVAAVAAWQLHGSSGNGPPSAQSAGAATPTSNPTRTHTTNPTTKPTTTRHRTAPPRPTPTTAHAVLTAARGRVWLLVRSGSATGRVLYEGVLEQGQKLPVTLSPRVWLRVGAPWNLDVRVSGRLLSGLPAQPGNVVLSPAGLAPAA